MEGKKYDEVDQIVGNADTKRVTYAAKRNNKWFVVADGVEGKEYLLISDLVFSPDGKRVAYLAVPSRGKSVVVVDGVEGKEYEKIAAVTPVFGPDSKHVAYAAQTGGKWFIVVDGVEAKERGFKGFYTVRGKTLVFDSPTRFHALAIEVKSILRVDVEIAAAEPSVAK